MQIEIYKDGADLAVHAADLIIQSAKDAISERGRFVISLSGGHTPKDTYTLLAEPERSRQMEWAKVHVFFGDERFVSHKSPDSNYGMALEALLSKVTIPKDQVYPMPADGVEDEGSAARRYQETLASVLGVSTSGTPPQFDLILLGLGDDGHTASLFPGAQSLSITDKWVAATPPGTLPPPVDRLTMTFPLINAARKVAFLVSGQAKTDIVADVIGGRGGRDAHPAEGVKPIRGTTLWMLDQASASKL